MQDPRTTPLPVEAHTPVKERIAEVLAASFGRHGRGPQSLLQHLIAVQRRFSFVPATAVEILAETLGIAKPRILAAVEFYAFLHDRPRGEFDILFSDNITDRMQGSGRLMGLLCERLQVAPGVTRADGRVTVERTSCTGMSDQGPALLVNGVAVTRLDAERVDRIADLVAAGTPLARWPGDYFRVEDNIRRAGLLLGDPQTDGRSLTRTLAAGAVAALAEIERAGLRGRGGAGFGTAQKWELCRRASGAERVVVCNADEGEPGTFKDRVLLTTYADLVVEGMTLCARILGAHTGFIYLRGEYLYLLGHLESVLARRRAAGLLGRDILGHAGFDFDIAVHLGAGAYICGEESALIESLEGKRGVTRKRPPFPVTSGFLGRPTVVNNVETFAAAARILERGADWYLCQGTAESAGSKILCVSGDVARPGIYEVPFGTSIRTVLADSGAERPQAVQIGGAAGATLAAAEFDRVVAFEDLPTTGSVMVFDQGRDMLDMVANFARFFRHESCGFCTPCRVGTVLLEELVEKVLAGRAGAHDLDEMRAIGAVMRQASHCGLGHTAPNHILDTLDKFPDAYRRRLCAADFTAAFDLDAALQEARAVSGPSDGVSHLAEA